MWRSSSRSLARSALLALAACALAAAAHAQDDWRLTRDVDGVRVYERGRTERTLPEMRGEVEIDASLATVLAVIKDVPGQTKWLHDCVESRVVRYESETTTLVYNRTDAPWPVSDRDVVLSTTIDANGPESTVVRFRAVDDPAAPPVDGVVRMPRLEGEFVLNALEPARTHVVYRLDIDPGGIVPAFIVRRTVTFDTLLGLRREATARAAAR